MGGDKEDSTKMTHQHNDVNTVQFRKEQTVPKSVFLYRFLVPLLRLVYTGCVAQVFSGSPKCLEYQYVPRERTGERHAG